MRLLAYLNRVVMRLLVYLNMIVVMLVCGWEIWAGLIVFILLVGVVVANNTIYFAPDIKLNRLYIPALDKALNSSTNTVLTFDLSFSNFNEMSDEYYDPVNITIYDSSYRNHSIANYTLPKFDEEPGIRETKWVEKSVTVNTTGLDREEAMREISENGYKIFAVDVDARVSYDHYFQKMNESQACNKKFDVKIGDTGDASKNFNSFAGTGLTLALFNLVFVVSVYF